jgi:hypothetical protein
MGANAQTAVPTFTAGQVLTAAQMNESARTGVPVFATTGTRDAAFGGTGEKTLAEGQMCYVEGTGLQTYNGTSWVTWGTAPSAGALVLVKSQTIGSAVSSVSVTSAFSATYDAYKITVSGGAASTNNWLGIQLGATTTNYSYGRAAGTYPTPSGTYSGDGGSGVSSWPNIAYTAAGNGLALTCEIINPYLSLNTGIGWYSIMMQSGQSGGAGAGYLANTTSYTDFTLTVNSGTISGGTIRVYGLVNS